MIIIVTAVYNLSRNLFCVYQMCISALLFQVCAFNRTVSKVDEFMNNEAKGMIKFHMVQLPTLFIHQCILSKPMICIFSNDKAMIS